MHIPSKVTELKLGKNMLVDAKGGKKRSSNCKIAGVSKTRSRGRSWIGVYLFLKKNAVLGLGLAVVRVSVNTNPNPNPNTA